LVTVFFIFYINYYLQRNIKYHKIVLEYFNILRTEPQSLTPATQLMVVPSYLMPLELVANETLKNHLHLETCKRASLVSLVLFCVSPSLRLLPAATF